MLQGKTARLVVFLCARVHVCGYVYTYILTHTYIHAIIHIFIYSYTHINVTHTHTHTYKERVWRDNKAKQKNANKRQILKPVSVIPTQTLSGLSALPQHQLGKMWQ